MDEGRQDLFIQKRFSEIDRLAEEASQAFGMHPELKDEVLLGRESGTEFEHNGNNYNVEIHYWGGSPQISIERTRQLENGVRCDACEINKFSGHISYSREIAGQEPRLSINSRWAIQCFEQMLKELSAPAQPSPQVAISPGVDQSHLQNL